jgi:archaellum component FlaC
MSLVILPKTDDEIKEERREWREEEKIEGLKLIAEQTRRTSEIASGIYRLSIDIDTVNRSINSVENQIEGVRNNVAMYAVIIILLLAAITINLYFY